MAAPSQLSDESIRLLRIIVDRTTVSGSNLMRIAGLKLPGELIKPLRELQVQDLIEVSGDASNESTVPFAYFGTRPSAKEYLYSVLKKYSA
jgi:hypothetical protein